MVNLLQLVAAGMAYAGLMYFITYNLGMADALSRVGPVVLISCLGILIAQPFWVRIAARIGKHRAYVYASLIHCHRASWLGSGELGRAAGALWLGAGAGYRQFGLGDAGLFDDRRYCR